MKRGCYKGGYDASYGQKGGYDASYGQKGGYDSYGQQKAKFMKIVNELPMCVKALISMKDASCILGRGGATSKEIGQATGTTLHVSGRDEFYPGTSLQELSIRGPSAESVHSSLLQVFGKLAEDHGRLSCGDENVEEGGARIKMLVPVKAARAIIGKGGENITALRAATGLWIKVDEMAIGAHDAAEQLVLLSGSLNGVQAAVTNIIEKIAQSMSDPGFVTWASSSQAGSGVPFAQQVAPCKGSLKGKGKMDYGKGDYGKGDYGWCGPWGGWGDGWGQPEGPMPWDGAMAPDMAQQVAYAQEAAWGESSEAMEVVNHAAQSLPMSCLGANGKTQKVNFNIPAASVSAIIGKGGAGVKEISTGTKTKIMIREIVDEAGGSKTEEQVTIMGDALGVVGAYLHIVGRLAAFEELAAAGGNPEAALEQALAETA